MQPKANFKTENCIPIAIYMTLCTLKRHQNRLLVQYIVYIYVVALSPHKNNINSTSYGKQAVTCSHLNHCTYITP